MIINARNNKKHVPFEDQFHGYQYVEKPNLRYDTISDSEGLQRAYQDGNYHLHGKTLYIAGSHTARDWFDDFTKIPIWGDLKNSDRYQKVLGFFQNRGEIDTVVGHSLGGSVALEFQKNCPDKVKKTRLVGPCFCFG